MSSVGDGRGQVSSFRRPRRELWQVMQMAPRPTPKAVNPAMSSGVSPLIRTVAFVLDAGRRADVVRIVAGGAGLGVDLVRRPRWTRRHADRRSPRRTSASSEDVVEVPLAVRPAARSGSRWPCGSASSCRSSPSSMASS